MKRIFALFLCLILLGGAVVSADNSEFADTTDLPAAAVGTDLAISAKACLLMEADTGEVLYAENEHEPLPPASVTKVMSLLLVFEAMEDGRFSPEDEVQISEAAAGKGGSQVYLSPGETLTVHELIKCVAIASANDATAALAEFVAGSEEAFVVMMNERAAALGMSDTTYINCTGLDDDATNLISAADVATVSRELMTHRGIFEYTTIWMDSIRDGAFGLTNTNKLIRFYSGANGLKTGSTSLAGFCISAAAVRDEMQLIAVIMGSESSAVRNEQAKKLFDYGFANYAVARLSRITGLELVPIERGKEDSIRPYMREDMVTLLVARGEKDSVSTRVTLVEGVTAPVEQGQTLGKVEYCVSGRVLKTVTLVADRAVEKIDFGFIFGRGLETLLF